MFQTLLGLSLSSRWIPVCLGEIIRWCRDLWRLHPCLKISAVYCSLASPPPPLFLFQEVPAFITGELNMSFACVSSVKGNINPRGAIYGFNMVVSSLFFLSSFWGTTYRFSVSLKKKNAFQSVLPEGILNCSGSAASVFNKMFFFYCELIHASEWTHWGEHERLCENKLPSCGSALIKAVVGWVTKSNQVRKSMPLTENFHSSLNMCRTQTPPTGDMVTCWTL